MAYAEYFRSWIWKLSLHILFMFIPLWNVWCLLGLVSLAKMLQAEVTKTHSATTVLSLY